MAAIDDLTTNIGALETASAAAVTEINTLRSTDNEAALEALAGRVATVTSNLNAAVPAPAPAPEPAA